MPRDKQASGATATEPARYSPCSATTETYGLQLEHSPPATTRESLHTAMRTSTAKAGGTEERVRALVCVMESLRCTPEANRIL